MPYDFQVTDLTETEIPASAAGRKATPNPLLEAVKLFNDKRGKSATFKVAYGTDEAGAKREAEIKRDLSRAGTALNVTVRRKITIDESAKTLTVTFWVTDKVARPAKDETPDPVKSK